MPERNALSSFCQPASSAAVSVAAVSAAAEVTDVDAAVEVLTDDCDPQPAAIIHSAAVPAISAITFFFMLTSI